MTQRRVGSLVIQVVKVVVVSGCVIGLLAGCSSRSRTTIVSVSDAPKVPVAQVEPERVVVEEVVEEPIREVMIPAAPAMDIPVEEPARPVIRRELPPEIFAKSKTPEVPSEISSRFDPSPAPVPPTSEPAIERPAVGIPPIAFEPEMPALPTLRDDQDSPVQVAKVMPQEPEQVEITTETLKEALSDIYFDYDRFSIRDRDDAAVFLKANAQLLTGELSETSIVIEGHCDERGTQSYNMVLGEARANAAKTFLEDLGISSDKIQVVSYGKDKPFCMEQTEECWQENRRGHFVIK
jgi:peptidoglycan-associated lipoprotein